MAEHAAAAGLTGLEFLSGIPGTIGGAVAMNAGAYGGDVAGMPGLGGDRHALGRDWCAARRRRWASRTATPRCRRAAWWCARGSGRGRGDPAAIAARMAEIRASREATQPVRARTGGSTFRNPPGMKAWELIDAAGCRGLTRGGAQVSEKHCNFLINTGGASAADIEGLGEEVRRPRAGGQRGRRWNGRSGGSACRRTGTPLPRPLPQGEGEQ